MTQQDDAITREVFIRAGIGHVWSLVTKVGFWVGDDLRFDVDAREGETVTIETARHGRFPVRVERLDPPRHAAYRWASAFPGEVPVPGNSTLVEFTLTEQEGGVLVQMIESGFASLTGGADFRVARRADNVLGWAAQLDRLRQIAEGGDRQ